VSASVICAFAGADTIGSMIAIATTHLPHPDMHDIRLAPRMAERY
jgi:hypothetical protein